METLGRYILMGKLPVPCEDTLKWGEWMERADNRRVAETHLGPLHVSTVFLGLDHNHSRKGDAILFETMIFNDDWQDIWCSRCSTWDEAERMHAEGVRAAEEILAKAKATLPGNLASHERKP